MTQAYEVAVFDGSKWVALRGEKGDTGTGITIKGTKATVGDLPLLGSPGESWLVGGNLHVWDDATGQWDDVGTIQGPAGPQGIKGDKGDAGTPGAPGANATLRVNSTTTGAPGTNARVVNTGTASAAVLDFTIPTGVQGPQGVKGDTGDAATVSIGTVADTPAGTAPTVVNSGTSTAAVLDFEIPAGQRGQIGLTGLQGNPGKDGVDGKAATVTVGAVNSGAPGTAPIVSNSGTSSAATLDFTIPAGATGATGPAGKDGAAATVNVGTVTAGSSPSVTNAGTASAAVLDFVLQTGPAGPQGPAGKDGSGVVIKGTIDGGTWPPGGTHADGDMWLIGDPVPTGAPAGAVTGHGVVYNGGTWTDVGPIQGPQGPQGIQGPAGPSAVSTDANNEARLGADSLIYVPRPVIPAASAVAPANLGTSAPGSASTYARADHVHQMPTAAQVGAAATSHTHSAASITGLATVAVSGEYADLKNPPAAYSLPTAAAGTLGGVKIGTGIDIDGNGVISVAAGAGGTTVVDATTTVKGIVKLASMMDFAGGGSTTAVVTAAELLREVTPLAPKSRPTFTDYITIPAGTAGAPGLRFTGDADTGIYQAVGGTIQVTANGSQRLAIGTSVSVPTGTGFVAGGNAYPQNKGTAGQVLTTDGAGVLTWQDAAGAIDPATATTLGGVKVGTGLTVQTDGTLAVSFNDATTTQKGVVSLADAAAITAGTAGRVVDAAQLKSETGKYLPLAGGQMTGDITWDTGAKISDPTANTFAVSTAGTERLRVGATVGIGRTNAASTALTVGTTNSPTTGTVQYGAIFNSTAGADCTNTYCGVRSSPVVPGTTGTSVHFWAIDINVSASRNFGFLLGSSTIPSGTFSAGVYTAHSGPDDYQIYAAGTAPSTFAGVIEVRSNATAAEPAICPRGDSNTGVFFPAADVFAVSTAGTERLRVDGTGQISVLNNSFITWGATVSDATAPGQFRRLQIYNDGTNYAGFGISNGSYNMGTVGGISSRIWANGIEHINCRHDGPTRLVQDVVSQKSIFLQHGSAAAPPLSFDVDRNTGLFLVKEDTIAVSTAGTERLRVGATGQITAAAGYTPASADSLVTKGNVDSMFVAITQAAYDALGTPDPSKIYLITG